VPLGAVRWSYVCQGDVLCRLLRAKPASATARRRSSGALAEHRPQRGRSCVSAGRPFDFWRQSFGLRREWA
jgi:hypothetical protein